VTLDLPDVKGRAAILEVHAKGKPLAEDVNLQSISKLTTGFSGADLNNLVNEAAILAARRDKTEISESEFIESVDRVMLGPVRRSRVSTAHEREITAYHEAGHATVGHLMAHADPIAKVTILSRGATGGHTRSLPEEDRRYWTLNQFKDMMAMAMGGRVAEQAQFGEGEVTTGASNDLENATNMARTMVTRYGMSEKLGPRTFGKREEMVFLGREISEQRDYSDKVAETIDDEVYLLVGEAYQRAKNVLATNKAKFVELAKYLLEHETADGDVIKALFNPPPEPDDGPTSTADPEPSPAV
jgi:cell division protease FtsH